MQNDYLFHCLYFSVTRINEYKVRDPPNFSVCNCAFIVSGHVNNLGLDNFYPLTLQVSLSRHILEILKEAKYASTLTRRLKETRSVKKESLTSR